MQQLKIPLPQNIDPSDPSSITTEKIYDYYEQVTAKFGHFCGDCKYLSNDLICEKGHRPRKYHMEIGPSDFAILRKNCKDFVEDDFQDDSEEKRIDRALDWIYQQYC